MEIWEELLLAEKEFLAKRVELFAGDLSGQLRLAMQSPRGTGMALRVLADAPIHLVQEFLAEIFTVATSTHSHVLLARQVMARLDSTWLTASLPSHISASWSSHDQTDERFRRVAETLDHLHLTCLLREIVQQARGADSEEVREAASDFNRILSERAQCESGGG